MNKVFTFFLLFLFACSKNTDSSISSFIYTSNYPLKLIVQEIVGDTSLVKCLVPPHVSEHTFEPKVSDINNLQKSKLVLYASDNLDKWATKSLPNRLQLLNLLPKDQIFYFEDGVTPDPHFWTSPKTVLSLVDNLSNTLIQKFPEKRQQILENSKAFKKQLQNLSDSIATLLEPVRGKYVFLFHPSFRYFIRDFGLNYGGSVEETPGAEPTPSHLNNLIKKIKETNTKAIFSEPQLNPHSAQVLAKNANVKLMEIDPIGTYDIKSYKEFVYKNAKTILDALK